MNPEPFQPLGALLVLAEHGVEFVIVGGVAATLHGSTFGTVDLEVVPRQTATNRKRLAAALTAHRARTRGSQRTPRTIAPELLQGLRMITFDTDVGDIDVLHQVGDGLDFHRLLRTAETVEIEGYRVAYIGLDELIAVKRAAGRPKDVAMAEELEFIRRHRRRR